MKAIDRSRKISSHGSRSHGPPKKALTQTAKSELKEEMSMFLQNLPLLYTEPLGKSFIKKIERWIRAGRLMQNTMFSQRCGLANSCSVQALRGVPLPKASKVGFPLL